MEENLDEILDGKGTGIMDGSTQRVCIKRIYESIADTDGMRILVDRLWPRGIRKENAQIDTWLKDVAPSPELREWFHRDRNRFAEFRESYEFELTEDEVHRRAVSQIVAWAKLRPVTLVYAAKDPIYNHVVVLQDFLLRQLDC